MKITRENYESFFLDYLEGNLEVQIMDEFIEFIRQNHDLAEELQQFEKVPFTAEILDYERKHTLYRQPLDIKEEFENTAVAWMEGDLDPEDLTRFSEYVETRQDKKKELELFKKTKLVPDTSVIFRKKAGLYRKPVIKQLVMQGLRVAAVLLFSITLWNLWPSIDNYTEKPLSVRNETVTGIPSDLDRDDTVALFEITDNEPIAPNKVVSASVSVTPNLPSQTVTGSVSGVSEREIIKMEIAELPVKKASVHAKTEETSLEYMAFMEISESFQELPGTGFLTDRIKEQIGFNTFSFRKLVRSGIKLASDLSGERFSYTTGSTGEVIALSLDTRLVGLKIPVGGR